MKNIVVLLLLFFQFAANSAELNLGPHNIITSPIFDPVIQRDDIIFKDDMIKGGHESGGLVGKTAVAFAYIRQSGFINSEFRQIVLDVLAEELKSHHVQSYQMIVTQTGHIIDCVEFKLGVGTGDFPHKVVQSAESQIRQPGIPVQFLSLYSCSGLEKRMNGN